MVHVPSFPFCIDWLPGGRLLVVSSSDRRLLRMEADGSLVTHADLRSLSDLPWNEIVVDGRGNTYLNNIGFDMMAGEQAGPGIVALVTPDGSTRQVADGVPLGRPQRRLSGRDLSGRRGSGLVRRRRQEALRTRSQTW